MKKLLKPIVFVLGMMSCASVATLTFCLIDIHNDYLSPKQIKAFSLDQTKILDWTKCQFEWAFAFLSLFIIAAFFILFVIHQLLDPKIDKKSDNV